MSNIITVPLMRDDYKACSKCSCQSFVLHVSSFLDTNVKPKVSEPILNRVRPPPKKPSLIQQNSTVLKPQKPPPLPPAPKPSSESIYEYFTSAPFSADIPHGISFEKDKKVTVCGILIFYQLCKIKITSHFKRANC